MATFSKVKNPEPVNIIFTIYHPFNETVNGMLKQ